MSPVRSDLAKENQRLRGRLEVPALPYYYSRSELEIPVKLFMSWNTTSDRRNWIISAEDSKSTVRYYHV